MGVGEEGGVAAGGGFPRTAASSASERGCNRCRLVQPSIAR